MTADRDNWRNNYVAMENDRNNWINEANSRLRYKSIDGGSFINSSKSFTVPHGCGVTPKYVFASFSAVYSSGNYEVTSIYSKGETYIKFAQWTPDIVKFTYDSVNIYASYTNPSNNYIVGSMYGFEIYY